MMNTRGGGSADMPLSNDWGIRVDVEEEFVTLRISQRQLQLIREAMRHYKETKCPIDGKSDWCPLLTWRENVHTGAIEICCLGSCDKWADSPEADKEDAAADQQA